MNKTYKGFIAPIIERNPKGQFICGKRGFSPMLGKKQSDATKKKIQAKMEGRKITWRDKISKSHIGKIGHSKSPSAYCFPKGEKNISWKGGITPLNHKIRTSLEYKIWRTAVFERDNYTCIWCGVKSSKGIKVILHADHIKQFAYYPELRFAIDNGRTLCNECHRKTDTFNKRISK